MTPHTRTVKRCRTLFCVVCFSFTRYQAQVNYLACIYGQTIIAVASNFEWPLDSYPVQASYNLVELLTALINESLNAEETDRITYCSEVDLAGRTANRTFNLSTGPTYIKVGQARNLDIDIFAFNTSTMQLQVHY